MIENPLIALVGVIQIAAGVYSMFQGDERLALINFCVGIANGVLSTMEG